jgi:transcriptional regulator with XRE-family HTH domain
MHDRAVNVGLLHCVAADAAVRPGGWWNVAEGPAPAGSTPAVGRRKLAGELRRLRSVAGLTIQDVATELECSAGKISRIETGTVGARVQDVRDMLALYRVPSAQREELLDLVRLARTKAWWQDFLDVVPAGSGTFYGLESGAARIDLLETGLIPGILQTEGYARALIGSRSDTPADVVQRRIELRMRRQDVLCRPDPPALRMLLDEAVLRREVGGPAVMAAQLRRLVEVAALEHVRLRVLPFGAGAYPAAGVAYSIFGFDGDSDPSVVYIEQLTRNTFLDQPAEVAVYVNSFTDASERALPAGESAELVRELAARLA